MSEHDWPQTRVNHDAVDEQFCLSRASLMCAGFLQHIGAVLRFLQEASLHDKAEHLLIGQTLVGLLCQGRNLPQYNPKGPAQNSVKSTKPLGCKQRKWSHGFCSPHIRVGGKDSIFQGLGGHPADREQAFTPFTVVIRLIDVSSHAEICSRA